MHIPDQGATSPPIRTRRRSSSYLLIALLVFNALGLAAINTHGQPVAQRVSVTPAAETPTFALLLPLVQLVQITAAPTSTPVTGCERDWDPRLDERGAVFLPANVTPGSGYWCLIHAVWYNSAESQGRRNIFVDLLDSAGARQVDLPVLISWPDGEFTIVTQAKPGEEYAADFPMQSLAPAYWAQPNTGDPADAIDGMGLGEIDDPFHAHHTSYGLVWQWAIAGAVSTPTTTLTATVTMTASPTLTTTPVETVTPTATVTITVTSVITQTPVPTRSVTPSATPVPSPTSVLPFARAEVTGCAPSNTGTRFSGTVFVAGEPADGYRVVFRFGEGYGNWATDPVLSGPNPPGFYTHIISAGFASAGIWSTWLVDETGSPISPFATFTTDGPGGACNWATVDFFDD